MAENENGANENAVPAITPYAKRIGNGKGRAIVGFAGSVRYDAAKRSIRIGSVGKAQTVAVRGKAYAGSVALNANESAAVLAAIGIGDTVPTMVAGTEAWKRFAASLVEATTGLRGIALTLPDVPKPKRGKAASAPALDVTDAAVLARLASLNG